ncbi:MAG: GAF domain-containing protein [Anaerolineaceae bacterium]|nr:GAF domain-containing protein [Anaerolineaceae bacterium]MCB9098445.1 GAF domain-containing protein [Anaerolineales bacterium]
MLEESFRRWLAKLLGQLSIRTYLIILFVVPVTITVALVSYLSFTGGQRAVNDLAHQLQGATAARIDQQLRSYLEIPLLINELNADNIRTGLIDPTDAAQLETYFWQQIQRFDKVSYIYLGNNQGGFVGAGRVREGGSQFTIEVTDDFKPGAYEIYATNDQGRRTKLLSATPDYDARIRPWYVAAEQAGRPTWSDVFLEFTNHTASVTASYPLYDNSGTLQGVLGTEIALEQTNIFLRSLDIGQTGQAFIIEQNGRIVASSTAEGLALSDRFSRQPPSAFDSQDAVVQASVDYLIGQFGNLAEIDQSQQLLFEYDGSDYFLQITPFSDQLGLDWLIAVVVPSSDFMGQINRNFYTTLALSLLGLVAAISMGILLSLWITRPILKLNEATRQLATETWQADTGNSITLAAERHDEVGQLAQSFGLMAAQLQTTVAELRRHRDHLEELVAERTAKFEQLNETLKEDIDRRQHIEQALKESERRLVETQKLAQLGSWEFDVASDKFTWSEEMFRITGLDPQAGAPSFDDYLKVVHPDDAVLLVRSFAQAQQKGTTYNIELRHLHPNGHINYVMSRGQPYTQNGEVVKLVGFVLDITERKRAEQVIQTAHDELAQRVGELALLNNVTQTVATVTDLPAALEIVAQEMVMAFNARNCGITLLNGDYTHLEVVADYSKNRTEASAKGIIIPIEGNLASQKVLKNKQSIVVPKAQTNPLLASIHNIMTARQTECLMIVPLLARGEVIGTIGLDTTDFNRVFTPAEMRLAETIAGQVAGAIEVARLFEQEHHQRQMAESLRQVAGALSSSLNLQTVLDKIMEELRNVIDYDSAGLSLQDGPDLVLFASANLPARWMGNRIPINGHDPAAQVFKQQAPMIIPDLHEPPYDKIWAGDKKVRGWMGVSLMVGSTAIGMLGVDSYQVAAYTDEDAKILQIFANQAAGAIQNARLHQDIRREKQTFEALLFNSPVATVMVLPNTFEITSWNPAAEKLFGYTQDEAIGHSVHELVTNDLLRTQAVTYGQKVSQGQPVRAIDQRSRKDGSLVDVEILGVPVMIDNEQVAILVIYHDITELEQARQAAEAANQAKSEFLSNMSHELRTPLNAIIGFSQLMMKNSSRNGPSLPAEYQENLRIINRSGEHLLTLINNVLSLSKIESGRTTLNENDFDFNQMLDDLEDMFRLRAQTKKLQLTVKRTDLPQFIRTDEVKLRQVLINLLNNALKFTEDGEVTLRMGGQPDQVNDSQSSSPASQSIIKLFFEVEDTGPGIAPEELATVFDAFVQTRTGQSAHEGTGLGLTISYQFVQLMGGELTVSSELGCGTIFKFDIKVSPAQTGGVKGGSRDRKVIGLVPNQPQFRILVVDDSATNRQLMSKLLKPLGFEVKEAVDGQDAIEQWQQWQPHLIWMDMRMPVMDGYEATRKIKATTQGQATAIIALTASTFEEEQAVVVSAGCDDFLRKPFREADMFQIMAKHIGVQYIYEDTDDERQTIKPEDQARLGEAIAPDREQTEAALNLLPTELVEKLREAATRSDMLGVDNVIDDISRYHHPLATLLTSLAQDFDYDEILALLQITKGQS